MPEVWVAGGAATHAPGARESTIIQPGVLKRILGADAWIVRSSGSGVEDIVDDYRIVKEYLTENGRDPATLKYVASQFLHVVEDSDRDKCLDVQRKHFEVMMGAHRGLDHLMSSYLFGDLDDVHRRIDEYVKLGTQYLILNPITDEIDQLDLIQKHIVDKYRDA